MKLKKFKSVLVSILLCSIFTTVCAQKIIINEYYRGSDMGAGDEYIEIVLLEDLTAVELQTFFVGDSSGSSAAKLSAYQFTNMAPIASSYCAGTIISVGGSSGPASDTTYDPAMNNWSLSLLTANSNITSTLGTANIAGGDVVWVDTNGVDPTISADGFGINTDSSPGAFAGQANFYLVDEPANNTGTFLNDVLTNASVEASWLSDDNTANPLLTPGAANGGANTTSIQALQTAALGTVTIADTPTNNEGNAGNTSYTFTVTRTASCVAASVDYAVTGTGASPANAADFGGALPSGTANFAAGATTATITINVSGDTTVEMDETFLVTIATPTGVALGATTTDTGTINNEDVAPLVVTVASVTDETSLGANDGTASVTVSGGIVPYTYLWSNGATTATITGLAPGTYTVVVTGDNGAGASASPAGLIVVAAALPPAIIPTLNQYMIMLLMLLVGLVAVRRVKA